MNCDICGPDTLSGERHAACEKEWHRRADAGECTKCSRNHAVNGYWCRECTPESPMLGYTPGASK